MITYSAWVPAQEAGLYTLAAAVPLLPYVLIALAAIYWLDRREMKEVRS